ncbi:MAG: transcriptional repressor [Ruminococcaceae bacterium]|nr:transcriptional repressor [Oscillospiraceae bacterium]
MSTSVYKTKQKKLIYDFFKINKQKQFTCDEITYMLLNDGTPVGKTTVYRQLENLIIEGKIKKLNPHKGKSFMYQYIDESLDCENHMHLRCTRCGKYIHLGCDFMNQVSEHISKHHNFTVDNSKTEILGICENCTEKE